MELVTTDDSGRNVSCDTSSDTEANEGIRSIGDNNDSIHPSSTTVTAVVLLKTLKQPEEQAARPYPPFFLLHAHTYCHTPKLMFVQFTH